MVGWWEDEWINADGRNNELQAVYSLSEEEYVIKPVREKIYFSSEKNEFKVGYKTYNLSGQEI
jgi:hypothetical protein